MAAPASDRTGLDVRDLRVSYGSKRAVDGVSFEVRKGEIFGLLGPNGAGKTTTLSSIEGLLRPDSGEIEVDGVEALKHPRAARTRLGVQLQTTGFPTVLSVTEIVRLYAGLYGVDTSGAAAAAALTDFGLEEESRRRVGQLSGGQRQRLAVLLATLHNPPVVLLDEPTAGLDPQARRQLWRRIEASRHAGRSILLTTHSMEEAQAVCDRVAIMDHGKILATGTPAALIEAHRDDPRVRAAAHGEITLDDVFIGLTGDALRD